MKKLVISLSVLLSASSLWAAYEDHFPTYFEYCGGSRWQLASGEKGGPAGHGFIYVHGLCKDYRYAFPTVIPCSEVSASMKAKHPHNGVGVSLDKNYANVKWVAVPGRDLTLFGNTEKRSITSSDVAEQVRRVTDLKVFEGVLMRPEEFQSLQPGSKEYQEAAAENTIGTDHAVNWARELHCVKIPTPKEKIKKVAVFLNKENNKHRAKADYKWSMFTNNCIHLSVNASNAMDFSRYIKEDQKFPKALFNLALPSNAFLMYADEAVLAKLPRNKKLKKELAEKKFSKVQVGSIMNSYPAFPSGDKFNTDNLSVLTAPRFNKPLKLLSSPKKYNKKYMTAANTELKANASMWVKRYQERLDNLSKKERGGELEQYLQQQLELAQNIEATEN